MLPPHGDLISPAGHLRPQGLGNQMLVSEGDPDGVYMIISNTWSNSDHLYDHRAANRCALCVERR